MKAEIYEDNSGKWRWRIRSKNGRNVAVSGESFASKGNSKRAVQSLVRGLGGAIEIEEA